MIRQIIIPTTNNFILQVPNEMLGKQIEITAIEIKEITLLNPTINTTINAYKKAIDFFAKNAVDTTNIKKWNREDLYE